MTLQLLSSSQNARDNIYPEDRGSYVRPQGVYLPNYTVSAQKAAQLIFTTVVVWNDYETQECPASVWSAIALYSASPQVPMAAVPLIMVLMGTCSKVSTTLNHHSLTHSLTHPNSHLKTRTSISCSQQPVAGPFWVGWIQSVPSNPISGPLLGAFVKLRKAKISFVTYVCASVRPPAWSNSAPTRRFFTKFDLSIFKTSGEKVQVSLKSDKNYGYFI